MIPLNDSQIPEQNNTFYVGTFPSIEGTNSTANDTENAARSLWEFAQVWFSEFPEYKPNDDRVSIWTESYGGRYGPSFAAFFQQQNQKIANATLKTNGETHYIHLDTLGIINGCVDLLTQELSYPEMAYNNTYGIQTITQVEYNTAVQAFKKPNGCRDRILNCRAAAVEGDLNMYGGNETVNVICADASFFCSNNVEGPYLQFANRGYYDITHGGIDPFPPNYFIGFLGQHWVQSALGVPINWTESVNSVYYAFQNTGDYARSDVLGYLEDLGYLLEQGIKVTLVYGDRDYACNWIGGEEVSLAVNYTDASKFRAAGYTDLQTNGSYVGGQTRQYGNFSFTRVYEAGHEVPAYQPQTAFEIFNRSLSNRDIATGKVSTLSNSSYGTEGPSSTWQIKNEVPPMPEPTCYILQLVATCTADQIESVNNGSALIRDYIVVDNNTQPLFFPNGTAKPDGTVSPGESVSGTTTTSSAPAASSSTGLAVLGVETSATGWFVVFLSGIMGLMI
jgi:carboxypeptidase D